MPVKNIDELEINFQGNLIRVSSLYHMPSKNHPGGVLYTCHLPVKNITIQQLIDVNFNFYWTEINIKETNLANELGEALINFDNLNIRLHSNILNDIQVDFKRKKITVSHSILSKHKGDTGNIVYTFHLKDGSFTIRQYNAGGRHFWKKVSDGNFSIAEELGEALESYVNNQQ